MATWEEASKCPRCNQPGRQTSAVPSGNPGNKVVTLKCENSACPWGRDPEDLGWIVELDPQGNVCERKPGDVQFPKMGKIPKSIAEQAMMQAERDSKAVTPTQGETPEVS